MTTFILLSLLLSLATVAFVGFPLIKGGAARGDGEPKRGLRFAGLAALGLAPVAAAFIYAEIGSPAALDPAARTAPPDAASAIAAMNPEDRDVAIQGMVEGLAARLAIDSQDLGGWRMLARSYGVLGRHEDAAGAWREALVLSEGAVDDWRGLAMSLLETRNVDAAPAIKEAFEEVLLQAPDDPLALYFLGHAAMSDGDAARARELWTKLRAQTPDDAPLAGELDQLLSALGEENTAK